MLDGKIKMEPVVLSKKENGKFEVLSGHQKIKTLSFIGVTQLQPTMYVYCDGSYNKDIILMKDIEDKIT